LSGPLLSPVSFANLTTAFDPSFKMRNITKFGFVAGVTLVDDGCLHVTAEGRFFDETALTLVADFKF
jgi:hypothetical protein